MYILKNSFVSISRNKGRNILIAIIVMVIAAAKVIVEKAGGKVTDLFGNDQRYDSDINGAVVSNGILHDEVIKIIKKYLYKNESE